MFRAYSLSLILASIAKLCVATVLAVLGLKVLASLMGYVSSSSSTSHGTTILLPAYLKSVRTVSTGVGGCVSKDPH